MSDPLLTDSGRINMGDIGELEKNPSLILDPQGRSTKSQSLLDTEEVEAERMAAKIFRGSGISWHLDEEASEEAGHDMFFPRLAIEGIAEKFGISRPHQQFLPEERNMFLTSFMNDCGLYLFNVEPFNEINTSNGVAFRPNKEWERLPTKK